MKKFFYYSSAILIALSTIMLSCKQNTPVQENPEELSVRLDTLQTGMIATWDSMLRSDDLKMQYIKRYISEIEFIPGQSTDKITELRTMYDGVRNLKFDRFSWTSDQIDDFDAKQTALIQKLFEVGSATPNIEAYPLVQELQSDISRLDLYLVRERSNYDLYSAPYNCLLDLKSDQIKELGEKYANLKKVTTFLIEIDCDLELNPEQEIDLDTLQFEQ